MSSILDALEKLERREGVLRESATAPARPGRRGWTAAAVLVAFTAGVGIAFWLRAGTPPPATQLAVPAPAAPAAVVARSPQPVAATARPTPASVAEAPPPVIASASPGPPPAPAPSVVAAAPPTPVAAMTPPAAAPAAPPVARPARDTPPPAAVPVFSRRPAGAPRVKVSFLVYSSAAERRRVALSIDDGSMVTLHEGEVTHDVEVERIFPDHVQLRHGGQTFTLRTRD